MIPTNYAQWRECIEVHCKIQLTTTFVEERLTELLDADHPKTATFEELYGADHLRRTIEWFRRAADELSDR